MRGAVSNALLFPARNGQWEEVEAWFGTFARAVCVPSAL